MMDRKMKGRGMKFGGKMKKYVNGGVTPPPTMPQPPTPPKKGGPVAPPPKYGINPPTPPKKGGPVAPPPRKIMPPPVKPQPPRRPKVKPMPIAPKKGMRSGGGVKKYAEGGSIYRKGADGVTHKGKTKARMVKMRMGGEC